MPFGFLENHDWNVLRARGGKGKTLFISSHSCSGPTITFRTRLDSSHVKDGRLVPFPVHRDGNARMLSISITDEQADALYALLKRYRKKRNFFRTLLDMVFEYAFSRDTL